MASTAINHVHLDRATFADKVLADGLTVIQAGPYTYARGKGADANVLYRTYGDKWAYLYQAKRVNTQANAGGGALYTRVTIPAGMSVQLVQMYAQGTSSAGAALDGYVYDEDGGFGVKIASVAAGADRSFHLPSQGSASTATANTVDSNKLMIGPGQSIVVYSSAGLQNETLTVSISLLLPITATSDGSDITWSTTGSAGTPSLANSTISATNTMTAVLLP